MPDPTPQATQKPYKAVRLRPGTEAKFAAIIAKTRWTQAEAIDALCDEFMAAHDISVPAPTETD